MEFGIVLRQGVNYAPKLIDLVRDQDSDIPPEGRSVLHILAEMLNELMAKISGLDSVIARRVKADRAVKRLMTVPGIGPITATALMALTAAARDGCQEADVPRFRYEPILLKKSDFGLRA
ncbi:MAG: family transposase [Caulobacteraceae bacterium]|nr:family transposase [Caulobacteraceae bacterium]